MAYEKRIVAFVDFLGFKNIVFETVANEEKLNNLIHVLEYSRKHFEPMKFEHPLPPDYPKVTHFSDSIVFSFPHTSESGVFGAINELHLFLIELTGKGYVCRGGIAMGDMIHDGNMAFGPAFVSAYELESQKAIFPRIIISKDVLENAAHYHAEHHDPEMELGFIDDLISCDSDNEYYIDYFGKAINNLDDQEYDTIAYTDCLRNIIANGLLSTNENVLEKYRWMAAKYDEIVRFDRRITPAFTSVPRPNYVMPAPAVGQGV